MADRVLMGGDGAACGQYSDQENRFGVYGGDVETCPLLHLHPETADMFAARDFRSTAEQTVLPPIAPIAYGCVSSGLSPASAGGEAHLATAEK